MKKTVFYALAAFSLLACAKENSQDVQNASQAPARQSLTALFADDTKTLFDAGTFKWKSGDQIMVRSNNAAGFSVFTYSGDATAGAATFTNDSDDVIITDNTGYAIYSSVTSGHKVEENQLKINLAPSYTWSAGNVQAPMLAKVAAGEPLEFKQLGGLLKVTYKNVPPKAVKLVVEAPVTDAALLADGKKSYKISGTMQETHNWEEPAGFGAQTPYLQAYDHSSEYKISVNINAATAAQRASDDGITVYIPLPVGPVEESSVHKYPQLKVWLAFEDNTVVPGTLKTASNVQIERATIKEMPAIALTKYSVEVVAGTDGTTGATDGTGTAAKFQQIRGLVWLDSNTLGITQSNGDKKLRLFNKNTGAVTTSTNALGAAPWHGAMHDGLFYCADKGTNTTDGAVKSYNPSTGVVTNSVSGLNNPMSVRFWGDDAYVVCRNASAIYKYAGGFSGTKTTFFDFSTLEHGEDSNWPVDMTFDSDGNAIVTLCTSKGTSPTGYKIYIINQSGAIVTTIGSATKAGDFAALKDGAAVTVTFSGNMNGITLGPDGALYLIENWAIRRISKGSSGWNDATVTTIIGGGSSYTTALGNTAQLSNAAQDIAFDPSNNKVFYFIDQVRYTLRKVTIE